MTSYDEFEEKCLFGRSVQNPLCSSCVGVGSIQLRLWFHRIMFRICQTWLVDDFFISLYMISIYWMVNTYCSTWLYGWFVWYILYPVFSGMTVKWVSLISIISIRHSRKKIFCWFLCCVMPLASHTAILTEKFGRYFFFVIIVSMFNTVLFCGGVDWTSS